MAWNTKRKPWSSCEVCNQLFELRNEEYYNFKIIVEGKTILAHRDVLIGGSGYFRAMLRNDAKENKDGKVEMHEIDYESVKICVDYIYDVEISIKPEKYFDLMHAADVMQMDKLCDEIDNAMTANVNVDTFFTIEMVAQRFNRSKPMKKCAEFAVENFKVLSQFPEFESISKESLHSMAKFTSDQRKPRSRVVFHDSRNNKYFLFNPNGNQLSISKKRPPPVDSSTGFSHAILNSHLYIFCQDKSVMSHDLKMYQSWNQNSSSNDLRSNWNKVSSMIDFHGTTPPAVVVSGHIYIVGAVHEHFLLWRPQSYSFGKDPFSKDIPSSQKKKDRDHYTRSIIEMYDDKTDRWTRVCELPEAHRHDAAVVESKGKIFCFGGQDNNKKIFRDASFFDLEDSKWKTLHPLTKPRARAAAASSNDAIFVAGGLIGGLATNSVEKYNVVTKQWSISPAMLTANCFFRLHSINGCLYVFGCQTEGDGYVVRPLIEKFDSKWRTVALPDGISLSIGNSFFINNAKDISYFHQ